ncbi:NRDE family protein [Deltaproteobacteria bacterium TL4]
MCLILFAYEQHPQFPLILAANRDEFYHRPTRKAGFWKEYPGLLAGKDLKKGGTWLGVTRHGRLAGLTNYRDPGVESKDVPSRGWLVRDFLAQSLSAPLYLEQLSSIASQYQAFNLLLGERAQTQWSLYYFSNKAGTPQKLKPGIYGLSNHLLDTPWPKVTRGKQRLAEIIEASPTPLIPHLFALLAEPTTFEDAELPDTGIGLSLERKLSPIFISTPIYGTRACTLILVDSQQNMTFHEKIIHPVFRTRKISKYHFSLDQQLC